MGAGYASPGPGTDTIALAKDIPVIPLKCAMGRDDRGGKNHDAEEEGDDGVDELLLGLDHRGVVPHLPAEVLPLELEQNVEEPRHRC